MCSGCVLSTGSVRGPQSVAGVQTLYAAHRLCIRRTDAIHCAPPLYAMHGRRGSRTGAVPYPQPLCATNRSCTRST